jgi:hypothetical protein
MCELGAGITASHSLRYRKSSFHSGARQSNTLHSVAMQAVYLGHYYLHYCAVSSGTRGQVLLGGPGSGAGSSGSTDVPSPRGEIKQAFPTLRLLAFL